MDLQEVSVLLFLLEEGSKWEGTARMGKELEMQTNNSSTINWEQFQHH